MNLKTLALNQDMSPYDVWPWTKSITKVLCDQSVIVLEEYKETIRSGSGKEYNVPAVVMLKQYATHQHKQAPYSRANIYARDSYRCQYCMEFLPHPNDRTIDHVTPRAIFNPKQHNFRLNSFENCVCCCKSCNTAKADKALQQAKMKLVRVPKSVSRQQIYYLKLTMLPHIPDEWRIYLGTFQQESKETATRT